MIVFYFFAGVTNKANEFHIGFLQNYVQPHFLEQQIILNSTTLFITTDDLNGATVIVTVNGVQSLYQVDQDSEKTIDLASGTRVEGPWDRNKGIHVQADGRKHISLFALNEELHSVEGFSAYPCTRMSVISNYEYYAISVPPMTTVSSTTADSVFLIVACEDNTTITITPTQEVVQPDDLTLRLNPGESYTITLDELQTVYIESKLDLTGSHVQSNAPISFFSGHECGNVPYNVTECDHLVEQLPPTYTWGKRFLTAPTFSRTGSDVFKLLAAKDETSVKVSCVSRNGTTLQNFSSTIAMAGSSWNFSAPVDHFCSITSDKQILVVQFTPGLNADSASVGDPFMVLIPAISQYVKNMTVSAVSGLLGLFFTNYLNIFVPNTYFDATKIKIDGEVVAERWVAIPCENEVICGYATQVKVSDGIHRISHDDPEAVIGVTVYGLSYLETYAYVGGLNLSLTEGMLY